MKRKNNLYHNIIDLDNIINMTNLVCKNVRNKRKVDKFEMFKSEHVINIKNRLVNKDCNFNKYNIFMITDPKFRIVMAQGIEDKIINHLIAEYFLVKIFEPKYIDSMVATRLGKGSGYGVKLLKKYLNEIKREYNNFYVLKMDIKKYFYTIDHKILKRILRGNIKDKEAISVLDKVIDSTNQDYINKEIKHLKDKRINYIINSNHIGKLEKEKLLKEVNNIPLYNIGKGCSIGNQTSQAFGLVYLYELSHYIKDELGVKYLIVYMDDIIIIHHDKRYLKRLLGLIKDKMNREYKLEISTNKTRIDSIKNGIDFLGYMFYLKNNKIILKLRKRNKINFKRKVKKINILFENGIITNKEYRCMLSSYKGLLMGGNCTNIYYNNCIFK